MVSALVIGNTILDRAFKENIINLLDVRYLTKDLRHGNMVPYSEVYMMSLKVLVLIQ